MMAVVNMDFLVKNADVAPAAGIDATKVEHQFSVDRQLYAEGATVVALASELLHISNAAGTIVAYEGAITTQATGADRTVDVDLQKSTAGGAFATVMTTEIEIDNTTVIRTAVASVISDASLIDGDILRAVVVVAGSAGAQAEGLVITLTLREDPA